MNTKNVLGKVTIASVCLVIFASFFIFSSRTEPKLPNPYANLGGDFTLQGIDGAVSLKDFRGDVVLMMFGFTNCPDVCPTVLANVGAALSFLDESQLKQTQPIFISVDPERDLLKQLDQYTRYFNPKILGISGEKANIDKVVKNYGGFYQFVALPNSELKYTVDHSTRIYIIDKKGKLNRTLYHNSPPQELAEAIQALL